MASKKTVIITLVVIFVLFIGSLIVLRYTEKIEQNPEGTVGNNAGNLNNGGYFCESDGTVYFANPYDDECLYRMSSDETKIKKMNNSPASQINIGGSYLYFYQPNAAPNTSLGFIVHNAGLYRCKTNGDHILCLERASIANAILIDNRVYYQKDVSGVDNLSLASIGTNKENPLITFDEFLINPVCARGSLIYYNGTKEDHFLYTFDVNTGKIDLVCEYAMWFPTLYGNTIYFLDIENNYRLASYDLTTDTLKVLTTDRVDCFNVSDYYIYYQKNDKNAPALMRMQKDGSNPELIQEGIFTDISITSEYMYCRVFGTKMPMYHMPVNGPAELTLFDGAKQAAFSNIQKSKTPKVETEDSEQDEK